MKKIVLSLAVILFLFIGAYGCGGNSSTTSPTSPDAVSISNFAFNPQNLTINKGETVTWTNNDSTTHTITSSSFTSSSNIAPGNTYQFTFNTTGTFNYHCSIHPTMTGSIIVK